MTVFLINGLFCNGIWFYVNVKMCNIAFVIGQSISEITLWFVSLYIYIYIYST